MKVLLVASTFPASEEDAAPAFVKDLAVALRQQIPSLRIDVLAPHWRDETAPLTRREYFDEHRFPYFVPAAAQRLAGRGIMPAIEKDPRLAALVPFLFAGETVALLDYARRHRPDVIYAHWFTPQGVTAALVSALTGIPWVLTSHANDVRVWRKLPWLGERIVRTLLPTAARISVASWATRAKMRSFFRDDEWTSLEPRVATIPMGVDVASLARTSGDPEALKERYGYQGKRVIYFIGRLAEKKGVTYLLDAFARMTAEDTRLVIAGDGPIRAELEAHASRLALGERVDFVGYVHGTRKQQLFELADVVAVPSIETDSGDSEGFPVVIMEALAAGKICVASDATWADGVLVDHESGFVVPQKESEALASALTEALALEGSALAAMQRAAREAAEQLDWAVIARRHHEHLFAPLS